MNGPSRFIGSVQASADPTEDMELATKHYVDEELNGAELTDTTYTFANGTAGNFTVTPEGGTAQTVSIGKPATAGTADKATAANLTTTQNAIAKYSNTTGSFANSGVTIDRKNNITTTGKLTVGTDPVNDMDVVTKQYFNNRYKMGVLHAHHANVYEIADKNNGNNIISSTTLKIGDKFIVYSNILSESSGAELEDAEGNNYKICFSVIPSNYNSYIHIFTYVISGFFVVDSYGSANASPTV